MEEKPIIIDGIKIFVSSSTPFSFDGIYSGQKRAGIELHFTVYGNQQEKKIDDLLKKDKVTVEEPFTNRAYEASSFVRQYSIQDGRKEKSYIVELREIDSLPPFDSVTIDEHVFQVLRYEESITSDKVGRHAVLKLSKAQLEQFRKLLQKSSVKFTRIGIDENPLDLRFGARMFWSRHTQESEEYFKQIVRLFPLDLEPLKHDMASRAVQAAMARMIVSLSARFELLVNELEANQAISQEKQCALLSSRWRDLVPSEQIDQLYDSLEEVKDAEEEL